jgi:copper chaperone
MTARYTVVGMTCDHCVHAVTGEVSAVPGIDSVAVDLASGALTVDGPAADDRAAVAAAVDEAGYQLA